MANDNTISILLAFEDSVLGTVFSEYLQTLGLETQLVDGQNRLDYIEAFDKRQVDGVVVSMSQNDKTLAFAKEVREESPVPLFVILTEDSKEDIIAAYRTGADDVMVQPALPEILVEKIGALQRRIHLTTGGQTIYQLGELTFNSETQVLGAGDKIQHLSGRETELLKLLADNQNKLVERSYILRKIWKADTYFNGRSLSVYVNHLRNMLAEQTDVQIMSIHGKGYKLIVKT